MSRYVYRYLDTVGDGSGEKNAVGDYSAITDFRLDGPPIGVFLLERMIIHIRDRAGMVAAEYGNLNRELTNGILVKVYNGDKVDHDLTDGIPVKNNADWGRLCFDAQRVGYGRGDDFIQVRWTFSKSGQPLVIAKNWSLRVKLSDSFEGLAEQYFMAQGVYAPDTTSALPIVYK